MIISYMVSSKRKIDYKVVFYDQDQWLLLSKLREKTKKVLLALEKRNLKAFVHGSVARGNVNKNSDIDIVIHKNLPSFYVENVLKRSNFSILNRYIVQATPKHSMKAYIEINNNTTISFPLMHLRKIEREFYIFGGKIDLSLLLLGKRVIGVDKNLLLIEPTKTGHVEQDIKGLEDHVAKILKISTQTIRDRVNTLKKRKKIGRTGVFIKKQIPPNKTFEMVLQQTSDENPAVRRRNQ